MAEYKRSLNFGILEMIAQWTKSRPHDQRLRGQLNQVSKNIFERKVEHSQ